jgi:hypothetical protein
MSKTKYQINKDGVLCRLNVDGTYRIMQCPKCCLEGLVSVEYRQMPGKEQGK